MNKATCYQILAKSHNEKGEPCWQPHPITFPSREEAINFMKTQVPDPSALEEAEKRGMFKIRPKTSVILPSDDGLEIL